MIVSILFIGEEQSPTAKKMGWEWGSNHLCSKTLMEALDTCEEFDKSNANFINLFKDGELNREALHFIREWKSPCVAMGQKVQNALKKEGLHPWEMIHPAARGKIRAKENYAAHVRDVISQVMFDCEMTIAAMNTEDPPMRYKEWM